VGSVAVAVAPLIGARSPTAMQRARYIAAAACITMPRSPASYGLYILAAFIILDLRRTRPAAWGMLAFIAAASLVPLLAASLTGEVSFTAYALELLLVSPFILFAAGFECGLTPISALSCIRWANALTFAYSMLSLLQHGFPGRIPYLNLSPDYLYGGFGLGGARTVTILAFIGLWCEYLAFRRGFPIRRRWIALAMFNFLAPSYILGIVCGVLAFAVVQVRRPRDAVLLAIAAIPSLWYALFYRLERANDLTASLTGHNPKELAYILAGRVLDASPLGAGPGQFSSTPQLWVDPGLRDIARQSVPHIPGLFSGQLEISILRPYTNLALDHPFALSSSINKPYTGLSTLFAEWSIFGVILLAAAIARVWRLGRTDRTFWVGIVFFLALNAIDLWIDSPWLGFGLLLATAFSQQHPVATLARIRPARGRPVTPVPSRVGVH
jgi:hypothetical protein